MSAIQGKVVSVLEDSLASVASTMQTTQNCLSPEMGSLRKRFLSLTSQMDDGNSEDENIGHPSIGKHHQLAQGVDVWEKQGTR